jgi:hypothetical protein
MSGTGAPIRHGAGSPAPGATSRADCRGRPASRNSSVCGPAARGEERRGSRRPHAVPIAAASPAQAARGAASAPGPKRPLLQRKQEPSPRSPSPPSPRGRPEFAGIAAIGRARDKGERLPGKSRPKRRPPSEGLRLTFAETIARSPPRSSPDLRTADKGRREPPPRRERQPVPAPRSPLAALKAQLEANAKERH